MGAAVAVVALSVGSAGAAPPPEPSGYKMDDYRSPTPATLAGARVVPTEEAERLWRDKGAVFVDTMPRDQRPKDLPPGTVWRDKPREHVPGSSWLANVGYGGISAEMTAYFRDSLATLSGGDMTRPLLFYCRADCWMSWNAGKRAMEWGYRDVLWYPEGTDGWEKAGLPLEKAEPYKLPARPASQ
ncbi:PQQ-dependent catabolism-associated CXXCW motif protein [Hansschlegelia zhihuaiae]|uniref:PQQ-dependent catabolism-associated CXXCW motif protein n=1 Tax=Hansschlegelia zhihuaiae TaxID=405005 RepID=A0A4Q0MNJ8_9HYPH|nr:PQQ-dependent catabolism-associated CXXCW motif protein [Hansschlegelia zhihuaiae]RXF74606.1 PQQ-dependent catabolism-associated CXXCW motif protein [Hansschlegelia zhihuaiae]